MASALTALPTLALAASLMTMTTVLGLTAPGSPVRLMALPLMVSYIYLGTLVSSEFEYPHPLYANLTAGSLSGAVFKYVDIVILSGWSADIKGPTSPRGGLTPASKERLEVVKVRRDSFMARMWWAACLIFNSRYIGTPWQIRNVPPFSEKSPTWVPGKWYLVITRSGIAFACCILLDVVRLQAAPPEMNQKLFAQEKVPFFSRLSDVTLEEIGMRYIAAAMFGIVTYLVFQAVCCALAVVTVALDISEPRAWPPVFGNILESWSLRRFWGVIWHQGLRRNLSGPTHFIIYSILGLPKGSLLGRYLGVVLIFFFSGLLHVSGEVGAGLKWSESGVVQYFCAQALGLMVEDVIVNMYYRVTGKDRNGERPRLGMRLLGYIWVLSFMAWSAPAYTFPTSRRDQGQGVLPIRIIDKVL